MKLATSLRSWEMACDLWVIGYFCELLNKKYLTEIQKPPFFSWYVKNVFQNIFGKERAGHIVRNKSYRAFSIDHFNLKILKTWKLKTINGQSFKVQVKRR